MGNLLIYSVTMSHRMVQRTLHLSSLQKHYVREVQSFLKWSTVAILLAKNDIGKCSYQTGLPEFNGNQVTHTNRTKWFNYIIINKRYTYVKCKYTKWTNKEEFFKLDKKQGHQLYIFNRRHS